MVDIISTTKNKTYKYIKSLLQKKAREENGVYTVEGKKAVISAVDAGCRIRLIAMSESFYSDDLFTVPHGCEYVLIRDELFVGLCDTKTPQGVTAVIEMKDTSEFVPDMNKLYIYCDNISDPGNLGTIIRTADAAGFGGVLISKGSADVFSPKTVRSSMGSFFNIDIIPDFEYSRLFDLKKQGFSLCCGALLPESKNYTSVDFTKPTVIIVGNEANGASSDILRESEHIIIPIYGKAESLNAGVAASLMMYEAVRQREIRDHG